MKWKRSTFLKCKNVMYTRLDGTTNFTEYVRTCSPNFAHCDELRTQTSKKKKKKKHRNCPRSSELAPVLIMTVHFVLFLIVCLSLILM